MKWGRYTRWGYLYDMGGGGVGVEGWREGYLGDR